MLFMFSHHLSGRALHEAMARFGVVVLPGSVCAPQPSGLDISGHLPEEEEAPVVVDLTQRCLRLSYVSNEAVYETAILRLRELILELCVSKGP